MCRIRSWIALILALVFACALFLFAACAEESPSGGLESGSVDTETGKGEEEERPETPPDEGDPSQPETPPETPPDPPVEPIEPDPPTHSHTAKHTAAKPAACTEGGNIEYWFCDGCGKYFADEDCINEISATDIPTAPTGHTAVKDEAVEATCIKAGLSEGSHCGECGEVLVEQQVLGLIPHGFVDGICSVCGDWEESVGLEFEPYQDGYAVTGIGNCNAEYIRIPAIYQDKPVLAIADAAFSVNEQIKGIKIPDGMQSIGISAFDNCTNLEEVHLGNTVEVVGAGAFSLCVNLKTVVLPPCLKTLDNLVFNCCSSLKEIEIPASVEKISAYAFAECAELERVILHVGLQEIESDVFIGCAALAEIVFCGTEEQWLQVVNADEGDYTVSFKVN